MPKYAKASTTKHERDRAMRREFTRYPNAAEIAAYSNPVAPPQHDHTAQLDAWADHVAQGHIVR